MALKAMLKTHNIQSSLLFNVSISFSLQVSACGQWIISGQWKETAAHHIKTQKNNLHIFPSSSITWETFHIHIYSYTNSFLPPGCHLGILQNGHLFLEFGTRFQHLLLVQNEQTTGHPTLRIVWEDFPLVDGEFTAD